MYILGKVLEAIGCADVGFGLYVGITQSHGMGSEFEITAVGILVFMLGLIAERYGSPDA